MRRAAAALLSAGIVVLAGCGGSSGNAKQVLQQTATRLPKIHSGTLDLRFVVDPRGKNAHGKIGFVLHGPFSIRAGAMPLLAMTYTQLAGTKSATARLVSNGTTAYAISNGKRIALSSTQQAELRSATAQIAGGGGAGQLDISRWIKNPSVSSGGNVGGAATDHVTADLDVVAAANSLLGLAHGLGSSAPQLQGQNAQKLADSVNSSSFDLWTGKKDHLLRRLVIDADFGLDVPKDVAGALGSIVGAKVTFELGVANPNQPVHVAG